ncbi:MAG TPA: LamG-like jellyroll fold domain-containing protein [Sedimentisphaerales bacterium]|nr:LamG-like jellyroll fold domain-containing protein [Sedimentisphaerales bacterium]
MCRVKSLLMTLCISSLMLTIAGAADKSLILYLPLDEGQGRTAMDASDYQNPGEIVGYAAWVEGKIGMALEIVDSSHVVIPEIPEYDVTSEVTLMTWMRTSSVTTWARLIDKSQWQTSGYDLVLNQGTQVPMLEFFVNNTTSQVMATTPVDDNEWHFIAGTFGNQTLRIYVDGIQEGEVGSAGGVDINPNDWPVMIGAESSSNGGQQYVGTVDEVAMFNRELTANEIQDIFENGMALPELASEPQPQDEAIDVDRDAVLSWNPGKFANTHDVYFGTDFNDVNDATIADPRGVTISGGKNANTFDTVRLEFGQTYYWRVDEVNDAHPDSPWKGSVWSFTTEPVVYPLEVAHITATASSMKSAEENPANTINGSGLDANDIHSTPTNSMWLSDVSAPGETWIQYDFDQLYKLYQVLVWNHNSDLEEVVGFGIKEALIETSQYSEIWETFGTIELARAAQQAPVDLQGIIARHVRITAQSNWGGIFQQYGLSEVRFFYIPVQARESYPDSGATGVEVDVVLGWTAGREAATHDVYVSTDEQAVIDGTAPVATVTETSHGPLALDLDTTYYWKVNEVNEAETPSTWEGVIWSFTTTDHLIVDDFESYNDLNPENPESNRIFNAWIDGYDNPENGSLVGYDTPPFAEQTIVHGGNQSLPLFYDNSVGYSEATLTLTYPRDWTENGVTTLSIWFRGDSDNAAELLYVALDGSAVVSHDNPDAAQITTWTEWTIDLQAFGVNLANVNTIALGLGNKNNPQAGGSGTMYFDDIRLYPPPPETVP